MMLWPEARRSPRVGIAGATPTPSADTHATARPADALVQRRRSGGVDLTEAPVHLSKRAACARGYGASCAPPRHPAILAAGATTPALQDLRGDSFRPSGPRHSGVIGGHESEG
jgi:hypothetical protein